MYIECAQRSLIFNENIALKSYSQAEDLVFWGTSKNSRDGNKGHRWNWGKYTTTLMNDFENVLAALIDLKNNENDVFPQRKLLLEDSKFYACLPSDENAIKYSATEMSDGERSVLYLAAQVLCVPKDKTLIIDEPEIHLHRSIMSRLWKSLEKHRPDCFYIYYT